MSRFNSMVILASFLLVLTMVLNNHASKIITEKSVSSARNVASQMNVDLLTSDYYHAAHFLMTIHDGQSQYRNMNDRFAKNLAELGLKKKDLRTNNIKTIKFSESGWFKATLDDSFGEKITIKYTPVDSNFKANMREVAINEYNDARLSSEGKEKALQDRQLRNRRTLWKCKTNFKYKVNGCDNSKPFKYK